MRRYLRGGGSKAAEEAGPDEEALLVALEQQVAEATLQAFSGSSELPHGGPVEQRSLLLRYLRAEKLDVDSAARRLERQAAWRRGWGDVTEEDVAAELVAGKVKLQPPVLTASSSISSGSSGVDGPPGARPLLIVKAARHKPGATPQALNAFVYFSLEAASHYSWAAPDAKLSALFDFAGLQLKNLDAAGLRGAFAMLAEHFPERLATAWMVDAPSIFWGLWKVVSPFIDSTTRKRIRFVSGRAGREELLKAYGPDILPLEYGGQAAEIPLEVAVQQLPAWRQRQQQAQHGTAAGEAAAEAVEEEVVAEEEEPGHLHLHTAAMRLSESSSNLPALPV